MKTFDRLVFDPAQCLQEVTELGKWLERRPQVEEKKHILPFFRKRRQRSAFIALYNSNVIRLDRIAFEYPLFGDLTCDLVIGDSVKKAYCFIEFEDASPSSVFVKQGKKATREWSSRLDHGFSQIIDWFYKLDDLKKSDDFAARFGARSISYTGVLIIGRDHYFLPGEKERLVWRRTNVIVASQAIQVVTFDGLCEDLKGRLETFSLTASARG